MITEIDYLYSLYPTKKFRNYIEQFYDLQDKVDIISSNYHTFMIKAQTEGNQQLLKAIYEDSIKHYKTAYNYTFDLTRAKKDLEYKLGLDYFIGLVSDKPTISKKEYDELLKGIKDIWRFGIQMERQALKNLEKMHEVLG